MVRRLVHQPAIDRLIPRLGPSYTDLVPAQLPAFNRKSCKVVTIMSESHTTGTPPPKPHPSEVDQHLDEYVGDELSFLSHRAKFFEKRTTLWYWIVA